MAHVYRTNSFYTLDYPYNNKCGDNLENEHETEQEESVECSKCKMWYHKTCYQLGNIDIVSSDVKWRCYKCDMF